MPRPRLSWDYLLRASSPASLLPTPRTEPILYLNIDNCRSFVLILPSSGRSPFGGRQHRARKRGHHSFRPRAFNRPASVHAENGDAGRLRRGAGDRPGVSPDARPVFPAAQGRPASSDRLGYAVRRYFVAEAISFAQLDIAEWLQVFDFEAGPVDHSVFSVPEACFNGAPVPARKRQDIASVQSPFASAVVALAL